MNDLEQLGKLCDELKLSREQRRAVLLVATTGPSDRLKNAEALARKLAKGNDDAD